MSDYQGKIVDRVLASIQIAYANKPEKKNKKLMEWKTFIQQLNKIPQIYDDYTQDEAQFRQRQKIISQQASKYNSRPEQCPQSQWPLFQKEQQRGLFGRTRLHQACVLGDAKLVDSLIGQGFNANAIDNSGSTPIELAALQGHDDIIQVFKKHKLI